ncbi:hypothetical protein AX17_003717 [Amanita inopinata Kibby_2008]|nr:hypothetical protein AX17_003717 [Amanita inopinata Kibby_2008]
MTNPKAQAAKEKGNAAFKSGDFPNAIGHYTDAILADRSDPTFPLNRAAAYLKLGKNEDAERDCTTVLRLNASNVKALFRRSQARLALGKLLDSRQDLTDALAIEPANASVREELTKVEQAVAAEKQKKSKAQAVRPSVPTAVTPAQPPPKRRRVPITIVDPRLPPTQTPSQPSQPSPSPPAPSPTKPTEAEKKDTLTPISTRSLKPPAPAPSPAPASTPPSSSPSRGEEPTPTPTPTLTSSFKEAKQARDQVKAGRVGGGIFRANGESKVVPVRDASGMPQPTTTTTTATKKKEKEKGKGKEKTGEEKSTKYPATMSMFNFTKAWEGSVASTEDRWKLITSIPPESIQSMCKSSLEPSLFISIIDVFLHILKSQSNTELGELVKRYLEGFSRVPRFSTVLLFLSGEEKGRVREVWRMVGADGGGEEVLVLDGVWGVLTR